MVSTLMNLIFKTCHDKKFKNMKKIKLFIIRFVLYVYVNYIKEDFTILTPLGKVFLYPAWFVRSFFVWLVCPILIPGYFIEKSNIYKQVKQAQNSPEYLAQMNKFMKMM